MLYKRSMQATGAPAMSAKEQAKELREEAAKQGAALLDGQEDNAADELIKRVKSGEIESVIVLDKDNGDTELEEVENSIPSFEITML